MSVYLFKIITLYIIYNVTGNMSSVLCRDYLHRIRKSRSKSTLRFYSLSQNTLQYYIDPPDVLSVVRLSDWYLYEHVVCCFIHLLYTYTHTHTHMVYVGAACITYRYIIHFNTETIFLTLLVNRIRTYNTFYVEIVGPSFALQFT